MAPEIGGYLGLERYGGSPYHERAVALNSARSCLAYLVELRGVRRVALPDLMCGAVGETCARLGVEVRTYRIGEGLSLPADLEAAEGEWLYVADYYGRLGADEVRRASAASGGRLVVDEVQGFFRAPWLGADTVYTCRKFFGVPDGAYLVTGDGARLGRRLPPGSSRGRMGHVLGRAEAGSAAFYAAYREAEASLAREPLSEMSPVTASLLGAVDYGAARERRERNYALLKEGLDGLNLLETGSPAGPYMYPMLVEGAGDARERLAARGVFVPTLWPEVLEACGSSSWAHRYARDVLPLPVDQRYGEGDMQIVIDAVKELPCLR